MKESFGKKLVAALLSPLAFGFYITLSFSGTAFVYYAKRDAVERARTDQSSQTDLWTFLNDIDQKSVDYRLRMRGPRAGAPEVAILAVDDRAIKSVGRWPWPREITARAIENAFQLGAKVIAADVVFAEPTDRPEIRLVKRLQEQIGFQPEHQETIRSEIAKLDSDAYFARMIEKYGDQFVLGNFHDGEVNSDPHTNTGYLSYCYNLVFEESRAHKIWNGDEVLVSATDTNEFLLPDALTVTYQDYLRLLEDKIRESAPMAESAVEASDLEREILFQKINFCANDFLKPESDPIYQILAESWKQIRNSDPTLSASSFDEWATTLKASSLNNLIPETLFWNMNIPVVSSFGRNNGYFNATLDPDGTIRKSQLIMRSGSNYMSSISFKAYLLATNSKPDVVIEPNTKIPGAKGITALRIRDNDSGVETANVPVMTDGQFIINYAGQRHMFPHVSLADLLDESKDTMFITQTVYDKITNQWQSRDDIQVQKAEFLKDKIFVLGATAIGVFDLRVTPFDENFPGVETHANVLDNLLRGDFLRRSASEDLLMPVTMLLLGLILTIALSQLGALYGLLTTLAVLTAILLIDRTYLFSRGLVVSAAFPALQTLLSYVGLTFYKYFTEERSKRELRATFSKYVSPAIVEEILRDPKNLELGGRKERITVFFSDVRGFTTISEKLDPRALSDLLNSYLTPMTDIVFQNRGTLDKYMGDAIMAFFGAPIPFPDHAKKACQCALLQLAKLKELQKEYEKRNLPIIDIGIGLNTGECSVGNMGSQSIRNYTVMGDAVNLASRLEGVNKQYGTNIIISEFTHAEVKDSFVCREVDWVRVKGKLAPVKIYELVAEDSVPQKIAESIKLFDEGYERYRNRQFEKATINFQKAVATNPEDFAAKVYIDRCQVYLTDPPPDNWDGIFVMNSK